MQWLFGLMALVAGASVALQPVLNATAAARMGHALWGALASAGVTLLVLAVAAAALRLPVPATSVFRGVPFWLYGGGLIGAVMLFTALFVAPRLGVATMASLIIAGQLATALAIDHFGLFGIAPHAASAPRILGALLLLGGVILIRIG